MELTIPEFQYRFMPRLGHVLYPGNFHPVGVQRDAQAMIDAVVASKGRPEPGAGGRWLVVGGSGGFGSGARVALGAGLGAHTLSASLDAQPQPASNNKIRKIGSPGFHRTLALDRGLAALGLSAGSVRADAFAPADRARVYEAIEKVLGGPLDGVVWALAAPRAVDVRTGKAVASALRPCGRPVRVKTFTGRDPRTGEPPRIAGVEIPPGTPEEAVATIFVMGGRIVETWVRELLNRGLLAQGATVLTISYRGNELNEGIYRTGLIGLAKADLEFTTKALDAVLAGAVGGRALAVEGPAVVTEASGGIPGVPLYMALAMDVLGDRYEDPLASMRRMFDEKLAGETPEVDDEGLVRMDDRELDPAVLGEMKRRFEALSEGDVFDEALYDRFMAAYARTRGFGVEGVDYTAPFDTDAVCTPAGG